MWAALEAEGLGCSLQHYNPLIDMRVEDEWKVSPDWHLKAQMVFGKPFAEPREKQVQPPEKRVHFHGAAF